MAPLARTITLAVALVLVAVPAGAAPAKPKVDGCGKLAAVDRWTGSFTLTVTGSDSLVPSGQGAATLMASWQYTASGPLDLPPLVEDGERRANEWRGEEQDFSMKARVENGTAGDQGYRTVKEASRLERNDNTGMLDLDCQRGTYRLSVSLGEFEAKARLEVPPALKAFCEKAMKGDPSKDGGAFTGQLLCGILESKKERLENDKSTMSISASAEGRRFDPGQGTLAGTAEVETNLSDLHARPIRGTLSWSLSPSKEPPLEVIVEGPRDYRTWKPERATDEGKAGGRVTVRATLRRKDRPRDDPGRTGMFEFLLEDVSEKPGSCTNCDQAPDKPDLAIEQEDNRELDVAAYRTAFSKEPSTTASVTIATYDSGGSGRLRVKCRVNGRTIIGELKEKPGVQELLLPRDDDHNQVADGWEEEKGAFGQEASWDEDLPAGQRRTGDGYTLYEEYRGFRTVDGFVRTDPRKKDLFIYDPDGLARQYYAPVNPAGFDLHFVAPPMIRFSGLAEDPDNRWVNFSSAEEDRYARQYAMFVKRWTSDDGGHASADTVRRDDEAARTGADATYDYTRQPLKTVYVVKISPGTVEKAVKGLSQGQAQRVYALEMESTVIHEMGHAVGIHHHWTGGARPKDGETGEMVASGAPSCAMRYRSEAENDHPGLLPRQDRYCRKGETWMGGTVTADADGNQRGALGPQTAHDCYGQIDVKSDP